MQGLVYRKCILNEDFGQKINGVGSKLLSNSENLFSMSDSDSGLTLAVTGDSEYR